MQKTRPYIIALGLQMAVLCCVYVVSRLLFILMNTSGLGHPSFQDVLWMLFAGLRFDISAIAFTNLTLILLTLVPLPFRNHNSYLCLLRALFVVVNSFFLLIQCIDLEYFKFTGKRSTSDLFDMIGFSDDLSNLLPAYFIDYWYIPVIWVAATYFLIKFSSWIGKPSFPVAPFGFNKPFAKKFFLLLLGLSLAIIAGRGGLQLKPINVLSAGQSVRPSLIPGVLNSSFTMIKTINQPELPEVDFMDDDVANSIISPMHHVTSTSDSIDQPNVVLIIIESLSSEYMGRANGKTSFTPFLDSLSQEGMVINKSFANGKKSIEALPAILGGIPALSDNPYISSSYGSNRIDGMAALLKKDGYTTSFFHGGSNGTMGFDAFSAISGVDTYYGRNEYNNDDDYDGNWGIYDHAFFPYFEREISKQKQPFLTTLFSISSHHPFDVPEKYSKNLPHGNHKILHAIAYTDQCLRELFASMKNKKWYSNTLFVITGDHTGVPVSGDGANALSTYEVPILFFTPSQSKLKSQEVDVAQHIDIMPTILSYVGHSGSYYTFGQNLLDSPRHEYAISYINGVYQLIKDGQLIHFMGEELTAVYDLQTDPNLKNNILIKEKKYNNEEFLKAIIQQYNRDMRNNKTSAISRDE